MKFSIKSIMFVGLVAFMLACTGPQLFGCHECTDAGAQPAAGDQKAAAGVQKPAADLPDGFYLVLRQSEQRQDLLPLADGERIVVHDQTYGGMEPGEPPMYVVVGSSPQVEISLAKAPQARKLDDGKQAVMLDFSKRAAGELEQFTKEHIGGKVAVVIGGKIATRHKIRAAITGGKLQVSCCGAGACEHLLDELGENYSP